MVSSLLVDALADPSAVLESLYEEFNANSSSSLDFPSTVAKHFASIFESEDALSQINLLTAPSLSAQAASRTLVHFRAMIQDTSPSPEVYLSTHRGRTCGWGLEANEASADGRNSSTVFSRAENLAERVVVWAVSIPGESEWCALRASGREGDSDEVKAVGIDDGLSSRLSNVSLHCTPPSASAHKFPLPGHEQIALRVKLYESTAEALKPTDLVSFVGILVHEEIELDDYTQVHSSTNSQNTTAPILHVLFQLPIPASILTRTVPQSMHAEDVRAELVSWIANEALAGDVEAAEWVLLACLSSVQSRNPPLLPLSLTLSKVPRPSDPFSSIPTLSHVLALLLPLHIYLPLSLEFLNEHNFEPESKDEDLHAGVLQLPPKSVVLVSEFGMQEGKLERKGVQNIQALQDVITRQTLRYNFPYSNFALPTDVNMIVMTEGKNCVFCQTSVNFPLTPKTSDSADFYKPRRSIRIPPAQRLKEFRELILASRCGKTMISEDVSKLIQDSFVKERKSSANIGPDDLVRRMAVAKLLALSYHRETLSEEIWEEAVRLDRRSQNQLP